MWIHVDSGDTGSFLAQELRLLRQNHPDWTITDGSTPPAEAGYEVLVAAVPSRELLCASPKLTTLQLPFAGVPAKTRQLLAEFPDVRIQSLHHNAGPTAELAMGLVLAAARGLVPADSLMRQQDWTARFTPPRPSMLLDGHPATVLGYGAVGRRVARGLAAVGMRVRAIRRSATQPHAAQHATIHPPSDLPRLLPDTRVLVLCLPAETDTIGLIAAPELGMLPDPAVLVNVSRAAIVDESALYDKLKSGSLAAGIDVWPVEATDPAAAVGVVASRLPFHELPNVVLSPHRGGAFSLPELPGLRAEHLEKALEVVAAGK